MKNYFSENQNACRHLLLKFCLLLSTGAAVSNSASAQVSLYSFASSTSVYTPIVGTVLFTGTWDDLNSGLLTIPFAFTYNNIQYTTVDVTTNGYITLGGLTGAGYCGLQGSPFNSIAGYATDLVGNAGSTISYATRGVTPNRQFVVQWTDCDHWNLGGADSWTFQIILNENDNSIQVVWGNSTDATSMGPSNCQDNPNDAGDVGLLGASGSDFNIRSVTNGTNTWTASALGTLLSDVCEMSSTNIPPLGLTYTWTPVPPTPMIFISGTTSFVNNMQGVGRNSTTQLLKVQVETFGSLLPFNVTGLALSTNGCTDAATDIVNAKVYFTGTSNSFSNATQFGSTINNPNGTYSVNGSATLLFGINYFWIAYTVAGNAILNDSLRGCCTQITGSGTMGVRTPSVTCPNGYQIVTELGFWTPVTSLAPDQNAGVMILLSDGTVMAKTDLGGTDGIGTTWDKLTPDIHGSYANGTWSQLTPMFDSRLYFSTQVLQDARVYVAGGEYGTGGSLGEIYDPLTNTWTVTPPQGQRISDANSEILPDGKLLQALVNQAGPVLCDIYDPVTNTYVGGPSCLGSHNESSWVKLPDQSVLMVNMPDTTSARYIPSLNQWIPDGNVPVRLYDDFGSETGAGLLLPNGNVFFLGATGHTAYYAPSGNTTPGVWTAGPDIPGNYGTPDAPAAIMVNGKILCSVAPAPVDGSSIFVTPTVFFEFNYLSNSFTPISAPDGSPSLPIACYQTNMLLLPDGNVLYSNQQDSAIGRQYYTYTPSGAPLASAKPTISSVIQITCNSFTITGTLFNGITEGAAYGDDWQMATNYPLVRLRAGGNIYYCRTSNWNRTDVMTGSLADTANFTLPIALPGGDYWLVVVVNGVASDSVLFHPPALPVVSFTGLMDSVCTVSAPSTLTGTPAGGTFSGAGIAGNVFNPSLAPLGNSIITYSYTDSVGCSNASQHIVNVSICTTIDETANAKNGFSLYPNPADKNVTLSFTTHDAGYYVMQLRDITGRILLEENDKAISGKNFISIKLDGIGKGIYMVALHLEDKEFKARLVVE